MKRALIAFLLLASPLGAEPLLRPETLYLVPNADPRFALNAMLPDVVRAVPARAAGGGGGVTAAGNTTFTGNNTFSGTNLASGRWTFGSAADAANAIDFNVTAGGITFEGSGADANELTLTAANPGADVTVTIPATTTTLAGLAVTQTFSAVQTFSSAIVASNQIQLGTAEQFIQVGAVGTLGGIYNDSTQTPDGPMLTVGTTANSWRIVENADEDFDFSNGPCAGVACTDPGFIIHSAVQDTTQYNGQFAWGSAGGSRKTLAAAAATSVVRIPVAAGAGTGGTFNYCVFAADATDQQSRCGRIKFSVVNKAGTETCGLNTDTAVANDASISETEDGNAAAISASTLTYAITCDVTPTNAVDIQINAASGLTETTLEVRYWVELVGPGQPARQ